ncbi:MAG: hypothetical protein IJ761_07165 [Bacteroidales bacterium]|nr:hypothetical protein [Bacteroidales bacterium]
MKKTILLSALLIGLLFGAVACSKEKTCRCAVTGSTTVRIIKIERGTCDQLGAFRYHNDLDSVFTDSLLCTDYEFKIDSLFND